MGTQMDNAYGTNYGTPDHSAMAAAPMADQSQPQQHMGNAGPGMSASASFNPFNPLGSIQATNKYVQSGGYDHSFGHMMPNSHNVGAGIF